MNQTCRACGHRFVVPLQMTNVKVSGPGMKIAIRCPACGHIFDMTDGEDGTWSTLDGRLVRAATRLAKADVDDLVTLRAALERALTARDIENAAVAAVAAGVQPPPSGWFSREGRMEIYTILSMLLAVIGVVLAMKAAGNGVTPEDVQHIIDAQQPSTPPDPPSEP